MSTLVKALLARKANPDLRTTKGTPLRRDTTDFNLPATLIGSTPYLLAARFLEPEIMKALVAGGADVKLTMRDGTTALMLATGAGSGNNSTRRGIAVIDGGSRRARKRGAESGCGRARSRRRRERGESGRRHGAARRSDEAG